MALTSSTNRVVATGDNSTVLFNYNLLLYDATHLQVYLAGILQTSGYTVNGVPGAATSVTFTPAPGTGVQVLLLRVVPVTQLSVYQVAGAFPAATTEKNFDLAVMALQQFDETLDRAVTLPVTSLLTATNLPDPSLPANFNRALKVKGDGTGYDLFDVSATPFSSVVTTKGDIAIFGASAVDRLPVGANGSLLIGASAETRGLKYLVPGTNGYVLQSDSAQADKIIWVAPNQPSNPIINGNMDIWQRGTAFPAAAGQYTADRWTWTNLGAGVVDVNRSTNVPTVAEAGVLFNYSIEVDVTTADASLAAGDLYALAHRIEGYNWRHFAQRSFVLSFWVRSTKTGIHCVSFGNSNGDRVYVAEYTINVTDTWEYKTVAISASPSAGTWDYTSGIGLSVGFALAVGSTYQVTGGSWQTSSGNTTKGTSSQVNAMDNTANFFRLTGVKLELGTVATPIQFRSFQDELALCKRYYQKSFNYQTAPAQNVGAGSGEWLYLANAAGAVSTSTGSISFPVQLRTDIFSFTSYNPAAANAQVRNYTDNADLTVTAVGFKSQGNMSINATGTAGTSIGELLAVHWTADAEL
jgi:hypothetical protein